MSFSFAVLMNRGCCWPHLRSAVLQGREEVAVHPIVQESGGAAHVHVNFPDGSPSGMNRVVFVVRAAPGLRP